MFGTEICFLWQILAAAQLHHQETAIKFNQKKKEHPILISNNLPPVTAI